MNESQIIAVAASLVILIISLSLKGLFTMLRKWMLEREAVDKKIFSLLDNIKEQIHTIQTDIQLQRAQIHEIETRIESRFQGVDLRMDRKAKMISNAELRIGKVEKTVERISIHHKCNHPDDTI